LWQLAWRFRHPAGVALISIAKASAAFFGVGSSLFRLLLCAIRKFEGLP
jgi:hypothetical protein